MRDDMRRIRTMALLSFVTIVKIAWDGVVRVDCLVAQVGYRGYGVLEEVFSRTTTRMVRMAFAFGEHIPNL